MLGMSWGYGGYGWRPYVSVAQRRAKAAQYAARIAKKERRVLAPVQLSGRKIADTFWGQAWCDNLERYSDFANRLPRGRSYVRNGSVIDLQIETGCVKALVSGTEIYQVKIDIEPLAAAVWKCVKKDCAQGIDSLLDLLQGRFDEGVMKRLTEPKDGLFPHPDEIDLGCSCPDWAVLCKHVAAVLYGIGARLDTAPELLFTLRGVDHTELIGQAVSAENLKHSLGGEASNGLAEADLGRIFGIEIESRAPADPHAAEKMSPSQPSGGSDISADGMPSETKKKRALLAKGKAPNKKAVPALARAGMKKLPSAQIDLKKSPSPPARSAGRKRGKTPVSSGS
jgi:uncharacterized Zn finger protein